MQRHKPHQLTINHKHQSGMALITVIMIATVLMILAVTFGFMAISDKRTTSSTTTLNETGQAAYAVAERARLVLADTLSNSVYTVPNFLKRLRDNQAIKLKDGSTVNIAGVTHSLDIDGLSGKWRIRAVSGPISEFGWIEVAATANTASGSQTIVQRISFGESSIFNLAMLTETVNCMFCHLRVNGDVGALQHFRPGWGADGGGGDGSGGNQGYGMSKVTGNVFAARTVSTSSSTNLNGNPKTVNGAQVTGRIETNSRSDMLPGDADGDGVADFPPINREVVAANALGTVTVSGTGTKFYTIPRGTTLTNFPSSNSVATLSGTYDGSIVLEGTKDNPINLSEDLFVTGDVVIKGYVTGRGAIYAGRNMYLAGDVIYKNPPDAVGKGVCVAIVKNDSTNDDENACAKKNIEAGKDEFRAAARGNVVVGDYTETSGGKQKPWAMRQAADFYRSQFGIDDRTRYFQKGTGDELVQKADGTFKNVDGTIIPSGQVSTITGAAATYNYTMRPGFVNDSGAFTNWLSDDLYNSLLGTESLTYGMWRYDTRTTPVAEIEKQLRAALNGVSNINAASITAAATKTCDGCKKNITDANGKVIARVHWATEGGKNAMRVITIGANTYDYQVSKVDAYLYANQRIAGKTFSKPVAYNGGMAAKELGILAPGRKAGWPWGDDTQEMQKDCDPSVQGTRATATNKYFVPETQDCAMTVNYDWRLRNGGYGYNQIKGTVGQVISWYLVDGYDKRVQ
jgi:hypothetical protein